MRQNVNMTTNGNAILNSASGLTPIRHDDGSTSPRLSWERAKARAGVDKMVYQDDIVMPKR